MTSLMRRMAALAGRTAAKGARDECLLWAVLIALIRVRRQDAALAPMTSENPKADAAAPTNGLFAVRAAI